MSNAGYTTMCTECDTRVTIPGEHETVVNGTKGIRTVREEYEQTSYKTQFAESESERETAKERLENMKQWVHYCPDHAKEKGLL